MFSSETSEEANEELFDEIDKYCKMNQAIVDELLQDYISTSSSSSETSEEIEPEEYAQTRLFIEHLAFNPTISRYELVNLVTAPQSTKRRHKEIIIEHDGDKLLITATEDRITDEDRERAPLRIENGDAYIDVVIENYVYASYFCNRHTGEKYRFALRELAAQLLGYGIQYSKNKFTKITIKYLNGPSHYIFGSGALVESGTYSDTIAYKTHHHSMRILAEHCHHPSIAVKKRKCQNIVAKGILPFGLCLVLLKHKYKNCVEYDSSEGFVGAIIRPDNIDHEPSTHHHEWDESESETDSQSDDSSSSYEYFERLNRKQRMCHPEFDYNMIDKEERKRQTEALLKRQANDSLLQEKEPLNVHDVIQAQNMVDLDDYQLNVLTKKKKITILAFSGGCIICAGTTDPEEMVKTYSKVLPMLSSCRDSEANKLAEAELIRKGLY